MSTGNTRKKFNVDRLKRAIYDSNMSQRELADAVGTSEVSISRYCNGARVPNASRAIDMAKALGVTVEWLYGEEPELTVDESAIRVKELIVKYSGAWPRETRLYLTKLLLLLLE